MNFTYNPDMLTYNITDISINIMEVQQNICSQINDMYYNAIVLIFVFYLSSKIMLPAVENMMKKEYSSTYYILEPMIKFYYSLTETLALCSITFILIMYSINENGTYMNVWIILGILIAIGTFFINKKYGDKLP